MNEIQTATQGMQGDEKEEMISVMEVASLFLKHWKWIALGLIVALMVAFLYLRYTTPVYNVTANVVLKEEGRKAPQMPGTFEELAMMGAVSNVENETYILRSRNMIRLVINRLNLHTSYIVEGRVKETDLYTSSPVIVGMAQSDLDELRSNIELEVRMREDEQIVVKGAVAGTTLDTVFTQLPALLMTEQGNISFTRREGRSEEHTSELQSRPHLVCRLLLEKKK